jgi:hypothetical protein
MERGLSKRDTWFLPNPAATRSCSRAQIFSWRGPGAERISDSPSKISS